LKKVYVNVQCKHMTNGAVRPLKIEWHDGRVWEIKRTLHSCASSNGEYEGIRYTVLIGSAEKYLYRVGNMWYVESIQAEVNTG